MASKVWDDLSMWNGDFSHVAPSFTLPRINALEVAVLQVLGFVIKVSAGEYAKYYFLLRSTMCKLGVQGGGSDNDSGTGDGTCTGTGTGTGTGSSGGVGGGGRGGRGGVGLQPLDLAGARRLQLVTETCQEKYVQSARVMQLDRSGSGSGMADESSSGSGGGSGHGSWSGHGSVSGGDSGRGFRPRSQSVVVSSRAESLSGSVHGLSLEQLMHAAHEDADGLVHESPGVARVRALMEYEGWGGGGGGGGGGAQPQPQP